MTYQERFTQIKEHLTAHCQGTFFGGCVIDDDHPFTGICPVREALDRQVHFYRSGITWKDREAMERGYWDE